MVKISRRSDTIIAPTLRINSLASAVGKHLAQAEKILVDALNDAVMFAIAAWMTVRTLGLMRRDQLPS